MYYGASFDSRKQQSDPWKEVGSTVVYSSGTKGSDFRVLVATFEGSVATPEGLVATL
jgi:hypothetical protein